MLSNAYFLAKFRADTAENEPAKNLPNFEKIDAFEALAANSSLLALYLGRNGIRAAGAASLADALRAGPGRWSALASISRRGRLGEN